MRVEIENVHPLQGGILRLKYRTDRRPGLADRAGLALLSAVRRRDRCASRSKYFRQWRHDRAPAAAASARIPTAHGYRDQALAPVEAGDTETLALFTHNEGARSAVQHARKIKELTSPKVSAV